MPLLILALIVLALSRPVEKKSLQKSMVEAKDIIIALDVSFSMKATDIKPNRYAFAKETIRSFLAQNPTDNIMLIAFTTNPLLLSPFTTDHILIDVALKSLNLENILTKGTSLKKLFQKLQKMQVQNKELIVMSDGGDEKNFKKLNQIFLTLQTQTTFLALGSKEGVPIENENHKFLKDEKGHLVISRINPLLEKLAQNNKGTLIVSSSSPQQTAQKLTQILQKHHQEKQKIQKKQYHYQELYQFPLFLALILFLLLHTKGVRYIIIFFMLFGVEVEASFLDIYYLKSAYEHYHHNDFNQTLKTLKKIEAHSLQSQILFANTLYKQEAYKKAIAHYSSIFSTSSSIKHQLYYNIANAYAKQQHYSKAKVFYVKSLQLQDDKEARFNLEQILFLEDKKSASLGIAHPKSQNNNSSKSQNQEASKEKKNEEDAPSSGSGGGGENKMKKEHKKKSKKGKLLLDPKKEPHPLGSKAYELINKGYIRETQPW